MYIIDSGSIFTLRAIYPRATFVSLWARFEEKIAEGAFIAPREARREIEQGQDELIPWVRTVPDFFVDPCEEQARIVANLHERYPRFIDLSKGDRSPWSADPWCIALAVVRKRGDGRDWSIVNQEGKRNANKLPAMSRNFGIRSLDLVGLFADQGWQF